MATPTYELIESITLTGNASSATFSGIPNTYQDLVIHAGIIGASISQISFRVNSSSTNYTNIELSTDGSGTDSGYSTSLQSFGYVDWLKSSVSNGNRSTSYFQFFDYAQTNKQLTMLHRGGYTFTGNNTGTTKTSCVRWADAAAINSITLYANFASGTTLNLYGIGA